MKCLETRTTSEGYRRRRYQSAAGHRFTTIEVPIEVWQRVNNAGRQRDRAAEARRALERESKQRQARHLRAAGYQVSVIATTLGIPKRTVHRWVGTTKKETDGIQRT